MHLSYFRVLFITVLIAESAYGSRTTNNEVTNNLPANAATPTLNDRDDSRSSNTATNITTQQTPLISSKGSSKSSHSGNNIGTTDKADPIKTTIGQSKSGVDQVSKNNNAINLFAQRVGNNIFHSAPKDEISYLNTKPNTQEVSHNVRTLIWSPLSVYQALLPLFYAAEGETKEELRQLLLAPVHPQINSNITANTSNQSSHMDFPDLNNVIRNGSTLSSVTGLFARNDVLLNPEYVQEVHRQLKNVEVRTVDFSHPIDTAASINAWVNESTKGLINDGVDETQLDPEMFMLVVNCIRFKASWQTRFNAKLTKLRDFHGVNGAQKVQMMKQVGTQKFAKFPIIYSTDYDQETGYKNDAEVPFSVLEMPYADEDFVSLFLLPDTTEKLQATMDFIDKVGVAEIRDNLRYSDVEVLMPKFRIKSDVNVEDALIKNGLKTLFNPVSANFTKFVSTRSNDQPNNTQTDNSGVHNKYIPAPFVSNIIHRTMFETTEEGTTAAALTSLSIVPLSALSHDRVYRFNLNRPFILLLIKNDNSVVFQGVIADLIGQDLSSTLPLDKTDIDEKTPSGTPIRNSLVYPSESEIKAELDQLINSTGNENQGDVSTSTTMGIAEEKDPQKSTDTLNSNETSEDRSWWIPQTIPEYLLPNPTAPTTNTTSVNSSATDVPTKHSDKEVVKEVVKEIVTSGPVEQTSSSMPTKDPYELMQFSKYQQPEPKDPSGIRFPATIPLTRNKVNIKPRYENAHVKNTPFRWMNVY